MAGVLLGVVLARRLGPEGSGYVASYRNIGDVFAAFGTLGLPQAFIYFVASGRLPAHALMLFAIRVAGSIATLTFVAAAVYLGSVSTSPDMSLIWIGLGGIGLVAVNLARGVLLGKSISIWFDVVSISPNILALVACAAWPTPESRDLVRCIALAYLAAGAWAILVTYKSMSVNRREPATSSGIGLADLVAMVAYGAWAWIPQILAVGAIFVTYRALGLSDDRNVAIGLFSTGLVIYNAVQGPLSLFLPALLRHWSGRQSKQRDLAQEFGLVTCVGNVFLVAVGMLFLVGGHDLISIVFGSAFSGALGAIGCLLFAAIAAYHTRLISSLLYAHGHPRAVALGFAVRFAVISSSFPLLYALRLEAVQAATLMAAIWAAADLSGWITMVMPLKRVAMIPWSAVIGLSIRLNCGRDS